jgi:hypothetical protein
VATMQRFSSSSRTRLCVGVGGVALQWLVGQHGVQPLPCVCALSNCRGKAEEAIGPLLLLLLVAQDSAHSALTNGEAAGLGPQLRHWEHAGQSHQRGAAPCHPAFGCRGSSQGKAKVSRGG